MSSNVSEGADRPRRSSSSYCFLVTIILIVAAYTGLTMSTLDSVSSNADDVEVPSYKKTSRPSSSSADPSAADPSAADPSETPKVNPKPISDSTTPKEEDLELNPASIPISITATTKECKNFDHGDTSPAPNVTSIFNCGSESGTCSWYFPAKFLHPCGVGKEFVPQVNDMKKRYDAKTLWLNGPPIVIPYASFDPVKMRPSNYHNGPWVRHNISMTHVHKTGGTSLVTSFSSVLGKGAKGMRHTVYMPARTPPQKKVPMGNSKTGPTRKPRPAPRTNLYGPAFQKASKFLDGAVKYRKEWGLTDHTLFGVVRDPADRFISAIGQAIGAFGSSMNGVGKQLVEECVKATSKESLSCFIDLVKTNSTWIEVHFTPMVLEISFATIYKDIPVAVFPFTQVPNLMRELGTDPNLKKKDGHKKGYRKHEVLTNMQVSDYDDSMMKSLCEVYKMDAVFLNLLGMPNSCDPHVIYPKKVGG